MPNRPNRNIQPINVLNGLLRQEPEFCAAEMVGREHLAHERRAMGLPPPKRLSIADIALKCRQA